MKQQSLWRPFSSLANDKMSHHWPKKSQVQARLREERQRDWRQGKKGRLQVHSADGQLPPGKGCRGLRHALPVKSQVRVWPVVCTQTATVVSIPRIPQAGVSVRGRVLAQHTVLHSED